jgi:hypothetical protein
MKLKALCALLGISLANDDILDQLANENSPQFQSLTEEVSVVDALQSIPNPTEEARKEAFRE